MISDGICVTIKARLNSLMGRLPSLGKFKGWVSGFHIFYTGHSGIYKGSINFKELEIENKVEVHWARG